MTRREKDDDTRKRKGREGDGREEIAQEVDEKEMERGREGIRQQKGREKVKIR